MKFEEENVDKGIKESELEIKILKIKLKMMMIMSQKI